MICRYTGALFSDFKREVAEKKNKEGSSDCEVNVPVEGSNIRFSIGSLSSLLHSSYVTMSENEKINYYLDKKQLTLTWFIWINLFRVLFLT